jgi:hypothetical protein
VANMFGTTNFLTFSSRGIVALTINRFAEA